jgi:type II secretory pathway pseudopilin PulG
MIRKAQGFALIDLIFVCGIIGVIASIAVPRMLLAKQSAGSASAIGSMRVIGSSELTYALTCGSGFYAPNLSTLGTPPPASVEGFISADLGSADIVTKSGYTITIGAVAYGLAPPPCNGLAAGLTGQGFKAGADPVDVTNSRFFATNANNMIYEDNSSLFIAMPEVGPPAAGHVLR